METKMDLKRLTAKALRALLQPPAVTTSILDKTSRVCSGSNVTDSKIDRYSYVGHDCFVLRASIGPFCSIADNCRLGGASHYMDHVSTSPVFHAGRNVMKKNFTDFEAGKAKDISIGPDVWIGANATVMSGVTIGTGAVIGAGSIVTKDVPPYEIWAGNPARKIRDRFDPELKQALLKSEWWNWSEEEIASKAHLFNDPEKLIKSIH